MKEWNSEKVHLIVIMALAAINCLLILIFKESKYGYIAFGVGLTLLIQSVVDMIIIRHNMKIEEI